MRSRRIDRLAAPAEVFCTARRATGPGMTVFDEPRTVAIEPLTWHRAGRPSWDCLVCHQPWPCAPAKVELAEEFLHDRVSGTIYLAMCKHDAINDSFYLAGPEPAELWNRFLGWYVALRPKPTLDHPPNGYAR